MLINKEQLQYDMLYILLSFELGRFIWNCKRYVMGNRNISWISDAIISVAICTITILIASEKEVVAKFICLHYIDIINSILLFWIIFIYASIFEYIGNIKLYNKLKYVVLLNLILVITQMIFCFYHGEAISSANVVTIYYTLVLSLFARYYEKGPFFILYSNYQLIKE